MKTIKIEEEFAIPESDVVLEKGDEVRIRVKEDIAKEKKILDFMEKVVFPAHQKAFPELKSVIGGKMVMKETRTGREYYFLMDVPKELDSLFEAISLRIDVYPQKGKFGLYGGCSFEYSHPGGGSNGLSIGQWSILDSMEFGIRVNKTHSWEQQKKFDISDPLLVSFEDFQ